MLLRVPFLLSAFHRSTTACSSFEDEMDMDHSLLPIELDCQLEHINPD